MRGCSAHPSLSVFRSDVLGFGGWLGGHEWRRSVISSNPPDEATSESESESSAQSVPESVGSIRRPGRPGVRSPRRTRRRSSRSTRGPRTGRKSAVLRREGLYHSHISFLLGSGGGRTGRSGVSPSWCRAWLPPRLGRRTRLTYRQDER